MPPDGPSTRWRVTSSPAGSGWRRILDDESSTVRGVPFVPRERTMREHRLADVFVTLVTGFDVVGFFDDLASACVELLDVTAAGLMLVDSAGRLRVMASSSEQSRML